MNEKQERHFCLNCNWELTEDEAIETLTDGCPYCGAKKGFLSLSDGMKPLRLPDTYLDNYLLVLQREKEKLDV